MSTASTTARKFGFLDDLMNPIAVKEMRQGVKGRAITWVFIIYLLLQLLIVGGFMVFAENLTEDFNLGRSVFMALLSVLLAVNLLFVPTITAIRLAGERSGDNVDLLFITTLRPFSIIWGKTAAAAVITFLLFSAALPFLTLTYLLRGVDLPSMLILLVFDYLVVLGCVVFGIMLGAMPGGLIAKGIRFLLGLGALIIVYIYLISFSGSVLFFGGGIASSITSSSFWWGSLSMISLMFIIIGFMFICSVTLISPVSANRAVFPRLYLVFSWLLSAAIAFFWVWYTKDDDFLAFWQVATMIVLGAAFFVSISEREQYGPRLRRLIPKNFLLRVPAFIFYSGAVNGMAFCMLMMTATIGFLYLVRYIFGGYINFGNQEAMSISAALGFYASSYGLLAITIRRLFFRKELSFKANIMIVVGITSAGSLLPIFAGFIFVHNPLYRMDPMWFIGNPFVVFLYGRVIDECLTLTGFLTLLFFIFNVPWVVRGVLSFKPLRDESRTDKVLDDAAEESDNDVGAFNE